jgi:transcriptional regulator with XRE-family HTH domain
MKERLLQLLDLEQLTPSKFADIIGVQRSSVSHVISGRNNPSFDFLQKTLKSFPGLNADWLMLGKGTMYEQMGRIQPGTLFDSPGTPPEHDDPATDADVTDDEAIRPINAEEDPIPDGNDAGMPSTQATSVRNAASQQDQDHPKIIRVVLFYSDDTFASFEPS